MRDVEPVAALQERAARATPAAVQACHAGDWLRHTDSHTTWWAGAALLHGDGDVGVRVARAERFYAVARAERFYAAHGAPARFQVCPACPPDLDAALAARRCVRSGDVSLQTARASQVAGRAAVAEVALSSTPTTAWAALLVQAHGQGDAAAEQRLVERVDLPTAYATARLDGRPVAVGRAVADAGWAGVFGMATLPQVRSRGAAASLLSALARWAAERGCGGVYLQVTCDSLAALALYARAGFAERCRYHYRTAPSQVAGWTSAATSTVRCPQCCTHRPASRHPRRR